MSSRPWSRWLGPAALAISVLAVAFVVTSSTGNGSEDEPAPASTEASQEREGGRTTARDRPGRTGQGGGSTTATTTTTPGDGARTYTVRAGDNLGSIAERTGVSVEELQELNPTADPQALTVGQKIKLAE
jgi:LysM repeat protein